MVASNTTAAAAAAAAAVCAAFLSERWRSRREPLLRSSPPLSLSPLGTLSSVLRLERLRGDDSLRCNDVVDSSFLSLLSLSPPLSAADVRFSPLSFASSVVSFDDTRSTLTRGNVPSLRRRGDLMLLPGRREAGDTLSPSPTDPGLGARERGLSPPNVALLFDGRRFDGVVAPPAALLLLLLRGGSPSQPNTDVALSTHD